jgi:hypothetical protein
VCGSSVNENILLTLSSDISSSQTTTTKLRVLLYFFLACADDEETQKKGVVVFYYSSETLQRKYSHTNGKYPPKMYQVGSLLLESMPLRISSFQLCLPDNITARFFNPIVMIVLGKERRVRSRMHTGSFTECLYGLRTFGLPTDEIPLTASGDGIKMKNHERWLQMQAGKEQFLSSTRMTTLATMMNNRMNNSINNSINNSGGGSPITTHVEFPGIVCPNNDDVLLGKGTVISRHPGNVRMRLILESFCDQYDASERKKDKTTLTKEIWNEITKSGARFLKEDPQYRWYVEVDEATSRRKIVVGMRDMKSRHIAKMQHSRSSTSAFVHLDHNKRQKTAKGDCCTNDI